MQFQLTDLISTIIGLFLTLFVFSYLLGDNPIFRLTVYIFIGVSAAYVCVMVIYQVLLPRLFLPLIDSSNEQKLSILVPLIFSVLLSFKLIPKLSSVGNISMGFLVGIGAAVAIGGAVLGTIISQIEATVIQFSQRTILSAGTDIYQVIFEGGFVLFGTICTLVYFHFGAKHRTDKLPIRSVLIETIAGLGKIFIAITFGALFAAVFLTALTALIERLDFIHNALSTFI